MRPGEYQGQESIKARCVMAGVSWPVCHGLGGHGLVGHGLDLTSEIS